MDAKQETLRFINGAKEEKDVENIGHANDCKEQTKVSFKDEDHKSPMTSSPKHENPSICKEEDELESAKEENERVKKMLEQVLENDYQSLQRRFFDIFQHESTLKSAQKSPINETQKEEEEPEVLLCLGLQTPTKPNKDGNTGSSSKGKVGAELVEEELSLGLDLKSSPKIDFTETGSEKSNGTEDMKEDELGETWPPSKVLKTMKDSRKDEELPKPNNAKRARVCVRARCDTPTMNDGCQWRKYGQKIAKGNPCPRAYYRCTVAPSCPVRKQVQRCSEDMSILINTYEGTHNHPLPVAATAMASTTSAAASILLSGSSTSEGLSSSAPITSTANLNGINFTVYNNARTGQFNLPTSSSPPPPTITLDLTGPHSSHFSRRFSNYFPSQYSSKNLDFSSSEANTFATAWSNNNTYQNYSPLPATSSIVSLSFGKPTPQQISYPNMERRTDQVATSSSSSFASQQLLTETLTKVLSSDPSFQSAVAAVISSMVGGDNTLNAMNQVNASSLGPILKWGDLAQRISINSLPQTGNPYTPTYSNKLPSPSTSSSPAAGSFMLLQPQFPFSLSNSSSRSDRRD